MRSSIQTTLLTAALVGMALIGCESAPRGDTGGRIDPYRSTSADRASSSANLPALLEFSDLTAQQLAVDLAQIPEIATAPEKQILELGDLYNKTRTSTTDFELIQRRVRGQLMQSKMIRDNFRIVEARSRMNDELNRIEAVHEGSGTARYDADKTYVLQGDFLEANRSGRRQYYFEFKLINLATRDIVFSKAFDLAQQ